MEKFLRLCFFMVNFKIVTLTGFDDIFQQFFNSANYFESATEKIVVMSRDARQPEPNMRTKWLMNNWKFIKGIEPFVFARNANIGIREAGNDDVLLTNDDVQFTNSNSLSKIADAAYSSPDIGIMSPLVIGGIGTGLQRFHHRPRNHRITICNEVLRFVCVYIKRTTFEKVGMLDERFDGYGADDVDFSMRTQAAGLKLAVTTDVVVRHGYETHRSSSSFVRTLGSTDESMSEMDARLKEKLAKSGK